jgi:hypothetical protein
MEDQMSSSPEKDAEEMLREERDLNREQKVE